MIITEEFSADKWVRFGNAVIDSIVMWIIGVVYIASAGYIYDNFYSADWILDIAGSEGNFWSNLLWGYIHSSIFYFILEATTQRTIGKFLTGTMVVMEDGSKPSAWVIFKRTLCRLIPFEPFSFFRDDSRGWHDTISDTFVVNAKKYKSALELQNSFDEIGVIQEL